MTASTFIVKTAAALFVIGVLISPLIRAQSKPADVKNLTFDVVSERPTEN